MRILVAVCVGCVTATAVIAQEIQPGTIVKESGLHLGVYGSSTEIINPFAQHASPRFPVEQFGADIRATTNTRRKALHTYASIHAYTDKAGTVRGLDFIGGGKIISLDLFTYIGAGIRQIRSTQHEFTINGVDLSTRRRAEFSWVSLGLGFGRPDRLNIRTEGVLAWYNSLYFSVIQSPGSSGEEMLSMDGVPYAGGRVSVNGIYIGSRIKTHATLQYIELLPQKNHLGATVSPDVPRRPLSLSTGATIGLTRHFRIFGDAEIAFGDTFLQEKQSFRLGFSWSS